jgi:hypothetical protein
MNWQDEARALPPPSAEEIEDWTDGVVYHQTADGATLYYSTEVGRWLLRRELQIRRE